MLVRRLVTVVLLAVAVLTVLLAVPDLRPVVHEVRSMNPLLVIAAVSAIIAVLAIPRLTHRISAKCPRATWLEDIGVGIPAAREALTRPSWRLAGAAGYLLFDIAVLWITFAAVGPAPPIAPL